MTALFIITAALLLITVIFYVIKADSYKVLEIQCDQMKDALMDKDDRIKEQDDLLSRQDLAITNLNGKITELISTGDEVVNQFREKLDESLQANADLRTQIIAKDKELEKANAYREEREKHFADLEARILVVSRDMPAGLNSSRKAERLSVNLRQYITETPTGASLTIVRPFCSTDSADC